MACGGGGAPRRAGRVRLQPIVAAPIAAGATDLNGMLTGKREGSAGDVPQTSRLKRSGTGMLPTSTGASWPEAKSIEKISSTELVLKDMSMAPATVPAASKPRPAGVGHHATVAERSIVLSGAMGPPLMPLSELTGSGARYRARLAWGLPGVGWGQITTSTRTKGSLPLRRIQLQKIPGREAIYVDAAHPRRPGT